MAGVADPSATSTAGRAGAAWTSSQPDWSARATSASRCLSAEVLEEHMREKPMQIKISAAYDGVPPRKDGQ
jgi:hypothetical protein